MWLWIVGGVRGQGQGVRRLGEMGTIERGMG